MFIPVGPDGGEQDVWTVDKDSEGTITKKKLFGVRVCEVFLSAFLPTFPFRHCVPCHIEAPPSRVERGIPRGRHGESGRISPSLGLFQLRWQRRSTRLTSDRYRIPDILTYGFSLVCTINGSEQANARVLNRGRD